MGQRSYRMATIYRTGTVAWLLHRVAGVLLVAYLYFHLVILSSVVWPGGPRAFNHMVGLVTTPPFIVADLALFAVVFYHALNGIRLLVLDLGWLVNYQRQLFWSSLVVGGALMVLSIAWLAPYAKL